MTGVTSQAASTSSYVPRPLLGIAQSRMSVSKYAAQNTQEK